MLKYFVFFLSFFFFQGITAQPVVTAFSPLSGPVGTSVAISGFNFDPVPTNNIVYAGAVRATVSTATPTSLNITIPVGATYDPISVTTANLTGFSSQPFLVTFTGGGSGFVAGSFASKVNYTTGANPQSVYSSDFDGDGRPDIAVVNANANILSIHRNTGSSGTISLETKLDLGTGVFPLSVCAGDVDGDGKPDIVVANYNSNTVSIFKNSSTIGTLSFAARLDFPVGSKPAYIGIADLDLDGKSDLAVANSISNTVSFVKNISTIGNISFAPKVDFATNTDPENIVLRDFDGDQITDMAVVNAGSNNVSVFRNTTTGNILSFASKLDFSSGNAPYSISAADLDGDGKSDLVTVNSNSFSVSVFRNTGSPGNISFASKADYFAGNIPVYLDIDDLDGDGKPDIATVVNLSNTLSINKNTSTVGNISFANQVVYATDTRPSCISLCDFDGDGKSDIAATNSSSGTVSIFRNTTTTQNSPNITSFTPSSAGTGTEVTITGTNLTGISSVSFGGISAVSFTVVSANTIKAIVGAGASGAISLNTPFGNATIAGFTYLPAPSIISFNPTIGFTGASITITGSNFTGASAVSFGGIAASSFVVVSPSTITAMVAFGASGNISVITPGGVATAPGFIYESPPEISAFSPLNALPGSIITINGNNFTGTNSVYIGESPAASFTVVSSTVITAIVGSVSGGNITVITPYGRTKKEGFYNGLRVTSFAPQFGPIGTVVTINGININPIADSNIVYFGAVRAIVTSATSNQLTVEVPVGATYQPISVTTKGQVAFSDKPFGITLLNPGSIDTASFVVAKNVSTNSFPYEAAVGDLNGDGKADLATTGNNPLSFSLFKNTGNPGVVSFAPKVDYATGYSTPTKISLTDINGDGKPDMIVHFNSSTIWVYKNNGINGAIAFAPPVIDTLGGASYENIAITDFDGDGKPDLASSNNNSNVVAVARNTSNTSIISFDTPLLISLNYLQSLSVAVGDFDRDGKMDMAVSCDYNQLLIFRNISSPGKILFENPVFITTNNSGGTTVVADFDNDDRSDISLSNHYYNKVSVFRNTGNIGSIQFAAGIDYQTGTNTYNLATGDINGDGKPDLVAANIISNSISIFQNNSTNGVISFSNKVDYFTGSGPAKVSLADFDNDGKTDIAVANNNSDIIAILRNRIREPNIVALCPNSNTSITSNITGANYQWQASPDSFFQNISNNSYYNGTNSSTLQLTGLPSSWYGYEYRCLVNGNYSKVFKIKFVNNWTGVVDSSWENPNNWSCGTMPDENTDVVISSGTMVLNSNTTCRSITVKPGATFTIYTGFTLTVTH